MGLKFRCSLVEVLQHDHACPKNLALRLIVHLLRGVDALQLVVLHEHGLLHSVAIGSELFTRNTSLTAGICHGPLTVPPFRPLTRLATLRLSDAARGLHALRVLVNSHVNVVVLQAEGGDVGNEHGVGIERLAVACIGEDG